MQFKLAVECNCWSSYVCAGHHFADLGTLLSGHGNW